MKSTLKKLLCGAVAAASAVSANAATKHFELLIPPQYHSWNQDIPMISTDGGKTGTAMKPVPKHCGWVYADLDASKIGDNVVIYRKGDTKRQDMLGFRGNWETSSTPTPIPLATIFKNYDKDSLYFVANQEQFLSVEDNGWYTQFPEDIEGLCEFTWPMVIYDTDAKLHPAFSCNTINGEGCQAGIDGEVDKATALKAINDCLGVTPGIVESTLDTSVTRFKRKPKLSKQGTKCFISEKYFNQLFKVTAGVNEASCIDLPFSKDQNLHWNYSSDFFVLAGNKVPGFFPVEASTDESIKANGQKPLAAARVKYEAEGPIFYGPDLRALDEKTGFPKINQVCNGPGWKDGVDCTGNFVDGHATNTLLEKMLNKKTCTIGWSCPNNAPEGWTFYESKSDTPLPPSKVNALQDSPRWMGERNQHFCTESHQKFVYAPGQVFSVVGDDDIWVFIDNKLAIDLGGTHLATPGFVDLDQFEGLSGKLVEGKSYNIDMFTCDRRTTMSNLNIETNILPYFNKGYASSCQSLIEGSISDAENDNSGSGYIKFYLVNGKDTTELKTGVNYGGIDLSDVARPRINPEKISGLKDGEYVLYAWIERKYKKLDTITIKNGKVGMEASRKVASRLKVLAEGSSIAITAQGAKTYSVMDMMGRVLAKGNLTNGQAVVSIGKSGRFLVRVDNNIQKVTVK